MRWMQVAIRPAKPFAFGILDGSGTPGFRAARQSGVGHGELRALRPARPCAAWPATVSSGVRWCRPRAEVRFAAGRRTARPTSSGRLGATGRPGRVVGTGPMDGQESHQLLAMAEANALAVLPDGDGVRCRWTGRGHAHRPGPARATGADAGAHTGDTVPVVISAGPPATWIRGPDRSRTRSAASEPCPPRAHWSTASAGSTTTCASR